MPTQQQDLRKNYIGIVHDRVAEQRAVESLTSGHVVKAYFLALMAAVLKRRRETGS